MNPRLSSGAANSATRLRVLCLDMIQAAGPLGKLLCHADEVERRAQLAHWHDAALRGAYVVKGKACDAVPVWTSVSTSLVTAKIVFAG